MRLMWICLLPTSTLAAISNILVTEANICRVTNRKYWDLMEWFFGRTSNVYVTHIAEHPDDITNHFYPDVFMKSILKSILPFHFYSISYLHSKCFRFCCMTFDRNELYDYK